MEGNMSEPKVSISDVLLRAFEDAKSHGITEPNLQRCHSLRARQWVASLARAFLDALHSNNRDGGVRVFWRTPRPDGDCRKEFGLSELLFDVCVCNTAEVESGARKIRYITSPLWAVESEFDRDPAEALRDFNKLVLSSAPDKLFIGPRDQDQPSFRKVLEAPARGCSGRVWLGFVPHPDEWDDARQLHNHSVSLWLMMDEHWLELPVLVPMLN
jgi:hypothetical protein